MCSTNCPTVAMGLWSKRRKFDNNKPTLKKMHPSRDAFKYFEYGMKIVGWLIPARVNPFYMALRVIMMWTVTVVPLGIFAGYIKEIGNYTPGEFLTSVQAAVNAVGSPVKVVIILLNMWRLHKAKELLDRLDEFCIDGSERIQISHCVRRCNLIFIIYQVLYSGYSLSTFLTSVFNGAAPWRIYNPFIDWRESTSKLWLASSLEYFHAHFATMQEQLTDVYPLVCGTILRVHLRLLRQRARKLRIDPSESERESYKHLVKCIVNHKLIKEYADLIRPIISRTIFVQFLLIGVTLGAALINLFFFADFWSKLATMVYITGLMAQTFPFCYTCDLIEDDCLALALAIFHTNWLGAGRGYKSALIYFLHNAQKPIVYTAGSIFRICMQTNIKVAKLAFSVVAFVKQLNLAEKLREK